MLLQIKPKADLASPRALALRIVLFLSSSVALLCLILRDWKVPYEMAALIVTWVPSTALIFAYTYVYAHTTLSRALLFTANFSTHYLFFSFFHISFNPPQNLQLQLAEIDRIEKVTPLDFPATCLKTRFTSTIQTLHQKPQIIQHSRAMEEATKGKLRLDALLKEELLCIVKAEAQGREHRKPMLAIEHQAVHDAAITRQKALSEQEHEHRKRILHWLERQYASTDIAPGFRESVPESAPESAGSSKDAVAEPRTGFAESGNDHSEDKTPKESGSKAEEFKSS